MHPLPFFDPRSELWYLPSSRLSLSSWPARYRGTHPRRQYHCTVLHVVLVVAHIFLFVVYSRHFEHKISVDINTFSTTWLPLLVTTALQTLGTIYLAVLLLVTQRLALRSELQVQQTLTAVHDKSSAWLGLGSAFISLWLQTELRTAPTTIVCITVYLLSIFSLHITIPGLFHVVPYNATVTAIHPTTLAKAPFTADYIDMAYDILPVYGRFPTLGLVDSMVYDVIPGIPSAIGNVSVNASIYEVQCSALPSAYLLPYAFPDDPSILKFSFDEHTTAEATISVPYNQSISTAAKADIRITSVDRLGSSGAYKDSDDYWHPIVVALAIPIVDSSGAMIPNPGGPWLSLDYTVLDRNYDTNYVTLLTSVQLLACSVEIHDTQIEVSAETREPVVSPSRIKEAYWTDWTWPDIFSSMPEARLRAAQHAPADAPLSSHHSTVDVELFMNANYSLSKPGGPFTYVDKQTNDTHFPKPPGVNITSQPQAYEVSPTAFDIFIMEDLGVQLPNHTNITLSELNASLSRALAAIDWYNRTLSTTQPDNSAVAPADELSTTSNSAARGEAVITVSVQRARLHLSLSPLIAGLVASTLLLALSGVLTRRPRTVAADTATALIDSAGILQFAWLLGSEPHLAAVDRPALRALRRAGLFDVQIAERRASRVYEALPKEEADADADAESFVGRPTSLV